MPLHAAALFHTPRERPDGRLANSRRYASGSHLASAEVPKLRPELACIEVSSMRGLEIGPLASPRVHKREGPVRYLDHASAEELRAKYGADHGMRNQLDDIVDVDYVIGKDMISPTQ